MVSRGITSLAAWSGMVGTAILVIVPPYLPRAVPEDVPSLLEAVANAELFSLAHFFLLMGSLLVLGFVIALHAKLQSEGEAALPILLALAGFVASTAMIVVQNSIQGIALRDVALTWMNAGPDEKLAMLASARAIVAINTSLLAAAITVSGVAIALVGRAVTLSYRFPDWVGWSGVLLGVVLVLGRGLPQSLVGGTGGITAIALIFHWLTMLWLFSLALMTLLKTVDNTWYTDRV